MDVSRISLNVGKGGDFERRVRLVNPGIDALAGLVDQGLTGGLERGLVWISKA